MDTRKDSATSVRIKRERDQRKSGEQEQREHQGKTDHLYDALAAMPMDQRIAMINRMAKRMGV